MKITLEAKPLIAALAIVKTIKERFSIPVLDCVKIEAAGDHVTVSHNNLDQQVEIRLPANVATNGAVIIDFARLAGFVKALPKGALVSLELGETSVAVRSGAAALALPAFPLEDWPTIESTYLRADVAAFSIGPDVILNAFDRVAFAISTEETRYYLNGVYLCNASRDGEAVFRAVACDGHRLAQVDMPPPAGVEALRGLNEEYNPHGVIVPTIAVKALQKILKKADSLAVRSLTRLSAWIVTHGAIETTLTTRHVDGTFPAYERVIPRGNDKRATVDREALAGAVKRLAAASDSKDPGVRLGFSEGAIELAVNNADGSPAASEHMNGSTVDYDAKPISIGFNARYLLDALAQDDGGTTTIKMDDPNSPTLFMARDGASALSVLMPVRR